MQIKGLFRSLFDSGAGSRCQSELISGTPTSTRSFIFGPSEALIVQWYCDVQVRKNRLEGFVLYFCTGIFYSSIVFFFAPV